MIKQIGSLDTYIVRHPELRAGRKVETCYIEGDFLESTIHFGFFLTDKLIGVVTLFKENSDLFLKNDCYRIRGMAVLKDYQKNGYGQQLIDHCEKYVNSKKSNLIWFNARIEAVGFYEKLNYIKTGKLFAIENIGDHYVMYKTLQMKVVFNR